MRLKEILIGNSVRNNSILPAHHTADIVVDEGEELREEGAHLADPHEEEGDADHGVDQRHDLAHVRLGRDVPVSCKAKSEHGIKRLVIGAEPACFRNWFRGLMA